MLRVKHVMTAWLLLLATIFIGIVVIAPAALMFVNGVPEVRDIGNYLLLLIVAFPVAIILCLVVGVVTFPIAVLLCATDAPPVEVACFHCGYDLTGNVTGTCPECGKDATEKKASGELPVANEQRATDNG